MSTQNISTIRPSEFILIGFPGMGNDQQWLSVPFALLYFLAIAANILIISVVKVEQNLHSPMYQFLSVLSVVDLGLCTTTLPKMLQIFITNQKSITFEGCFVQMFCVHFFSTVESSVLVIMAYDRYVAIYNPLRYTTILTNAFLVKFFSILVLRDFILTGLIPTLASRLPYCASNLISHCYCDHMAVAKLACTNISMNSYYGLFVAFSVLGLDALFITSTYVMILRAVLKLGSKAARLKALNTCGSHLFVILYFYITSFFNFLVYRVGQNIPPQIHITFAVLYLLVPPVLNPLVYAIRTKEIRHAFVKHFLKKQVNSSNEQ
ncbi:olfactory receptor 52E4-like [Polypterus senegalus]|uniref:olfactory receptor 52E4-like n=1 Tax=Polypterus senegalus TaxID=55291 RepID=UPI0019653DC9|nr:olfactory receptor 52E4-like [Polypterus senegalus]